MITICAWCRKVKEPDGTWRAADMIDMRAVAVGAVRAITGICPECEAEATADIAPGDFCGGAK